jgi:putative tryptophan/tyrosine transport system substrate-binding protein
MIPSLLSELGRHLKGWKPMRIALLEVVITLMAVCPSWGQPGIHRIAVLTPGGTYDPVLMGLNDGLHNLGYKEGKNVTFIVDSTNGSTSDLAPRVAKLLSTKPDVLYTVATAHATAAKQATATVPVVFAWVGDPVYSRLIATYASSKNNLTGISNSSDALSGKRLEILLEIVPKVRRLLAIVAPNENIAQSSIRFLQEAARKFGVHVVRRDATTEEEIKQRLRETPKGSVDAIYHVPSAFVATHIGLLIEKAKQDRIPLVVHEDSMARKGALFSYGPDFRSVGAQSARLVAKVMEGEKPSEIPSEGPDRLSLVLNLSTAKTIGLKVPRGVLANVDHLVD